jgi:cobalt/nickel transport system permease protein
MHIPDGFISVPVAVGTGLVSVAGLALALGRARKSLGVESAPILGLTTAFVFAAQMINFPVTGGTSGHLLGGTLAAIILGSPWGAMLCIATVLIIQAVLFADGGITALGANIFNMAIISVWVGWGLSQTIRRMLTGRMGLVVSAGIAAGISVVVASVACGIELSMSGTASPQVVLPAMTGVHILIGVGEGLITSGVLSYLASVRPDLLPKDQGRIKGWLVPVVSIFLVAGVLSLFASTWPDGLDSVAEKLQFDELAENVRVSLPTPFADYTFPGLDKIGTSIAGIIGSTLCFAIAFGIAKVIKGAES